VRHLRGEEPGVSGAGSSWFELVRAGSGLTRVGSGWFGADPGWFGAHPGCFRLLRSGFRLVRVASGCFGVLPGAASGLHQSCFGSVPGLSLESLLASESASELLEQLASGSSCAGSMLVSVPRGPCEAAFAGCTWASLPECTWARFVRHVGAIHASRGRAPGCLSTPFVPHGRVRAAHRHLPGSTLAPLVRHGARFVRARCARSCSRLGG